MQFALVSGRMKHKMRQAGSMAHWNTRKKMSRYAANKLTTMCGANKDPCCSLNSLSENPAVGPDVNPSI